LVYLPEENFTINIILIFTFFVLILGVYDDFKNIKPKIKLFIQLFLVIITVYLSEIKIESLGFLLGLPFPQDLGLLAIPFTIISIMGLMNAFNMVDGLDGQAGLTSFLALIGIFIFPKNRKIRFKNFDFLFCLK
jgi:UDP-N-acetylmuramyl pentapeptide phosphotransferase/UDP-N-acetylglucosamine-1-phosphate transferase